MWLSILYDSHRVTLVHTRKKEKNKTKKKSWLSFLLPFCNESKFECAFSLFHPSIWNRFGLSRKA